MIRISPRHEELIRVWDRYVDAEGRTTLNKEDYKEHRKVLAEKAKVKKLLQKSNQVNKKKF
jgi:hypothetical protein